MDTFNWKALRRLNFQKLSDSGAELDDIARNAAFYQIFVAYVLFFNLKCLFFVFRIFFIKAVFQ
jgi:hypothetical protein